MIRIFNFALLMTLMAFSNSARADHFAIELEVKGPKASHTAKTETAGLGVKPKPRAVLEMQAGDQVTVKWTLASTSSKDTIKDVLVHFYAVKISKAGDPPPPKLDKDVLLETALTMDFKPKDKTEAELSFTIDTPGSYLLRLETRDSAGTEGHEHYAALDVIVK